MIHVMGTGVREMGIRGRMKRLDVAPVQALPANSGALAQSY
ncbi:hypothetical protein SAMN05216466_101723 [Paraburkholderia phenazinium]|jgi:hypothetical protein|uniref:Uncharacterized protein n=1 Tax=Paraburkholderia phenazinium TaxID=60549 RepID=A0A1G7QDY5_9BURK|nr:hypothetical protein SAMN05216466_101723 [Paraburkholderia phenazinium]